MEQTITNNQLLHHVIRVSKEDSAFLYFQLEANEGLCFFSTLSSSLGEPFRDIELFAPTSLTKEINHLLEYLSSCMTMQFLEKKIVDDRSDLLIKSENASYD